MIHLKSILFKSLNRDNFPYNLPFFNQTINFNRPVTILVGENGCGKSTFLELIRAKLDLFQIGKPLIGIPWIESDMKLYLNIPRGFYFSSEDFTTYIYELEKEKEYSLNNIEKIKEDYKGKSSYSQILAAAPHRRTLHEINSLYDRNLISSSHGEAYLSFFKSRLKPNQLILLDEPETPLSFQNQLSMLYLLKEAEKSNCQIIIATHSPVIMAYPNAQIYYFGEERLENIQFASIDNVRMMRDFLNSPERFLKHLFDN